MRIIRNTAIIAHWLRLGADGFRLDVADELPDSFISELRTRMKQIKKDSFLIGEVWEDASNKCSYGVRRKYFTENIVGRQVIITCTDKEFAYDGKGSYFSIEDGKATQIF